MTDKEKFYKVMLDDYTLEMYGIALDLQRITVATKTPEQLGKQLEDLKTKMVNKLIQRMEQEQ